MSSPYGGNALDQLKWFIGLLNKHNVPYWIDSGTLLGLMRDGKLLDSDHDLDIGIWENDEPSLRPVLKEIASEGAFTVKSETYKCSLLLYTMMPKNTLNHLKIDIGIFKEHGEYAYRHAPIYSSSKNLIYKYLFKTGRFLHHLRRKSRTYVSHDSSNVLISNLELSSWRMHLFYDPNGTWWIPSSYFKNLNSVSFVGLTVNVPNKWQDYLSYRYGDWKIPAKEWAYYLHDKAFKHSIPSELIDTR